MTLSRLLAVSLLLAPVALTASAIRVGYKDTFATARGNAFTATADTPAAVYYNPAGLTQIEGQAVSASIYAIQLESEYSGALGASDLEREFKALPQLYYAVSPADEKYSFGLGVYSSFGLATEWPVSAPFSPVATQSELKNIDVAAIVAYELAPGLSIGAGPVYHTADTRLQRLAGPTNTYTFDGDGDAVGFSAGLHWQPSVRHAFGLSYQHHYDIDFDGTADVSGLVPPQSASASLTLPEIVMLGYSFRPSPKWNIEANLDWTNWDRVNSLTISVPTAPPLGATQTLNWESGFFYDFGVTRYLENGFNLSAGYTFSENSIPDSTYSPAIPDADRHLFALGVGYENDGLSLNLAYQFGYSPDRDVQGSPYGALVDGTYKNRTHAISASLDYRF